MHLKETGLWGLVKNTAEMQVVLDWVTSATHTMTKVAKVSFDNKPRFNCGALTLPIDVNILNMYKRVLLKLVGMDYSGTALKE